MTVGVQQILDYWVLLGKVRTCQASFCKAALLRDG